MSHNFGWLPEQAAEDALHAERLLFIEEKPFQRVSKRLLGEDSVLRKAPRQQPTPPPEGEDIEGGTEQLEAPFSREKFWEDVLIDFAALQSSITRIQLIHSSNERERQRYADEKTKILQTAQTVRENTASLHEHLKEAQADLQLRKGYDDFASKILDDKKLKSRTEAQKQIQALEKEIEDLQAEGAEIDALWSVRREGFEKVVHEGKAYIRAIKGIKDQPDEETPDEEMEGVGEPADSNVDTPRPGVGTPTAEVGDMTPLPINIEEPEQTKLREVEVAEDANTAEDDTTAMTGVDASHVIGDQSEETKAEDNLQVMEDQKAEVEAEGSNMVVEAMDET